MSELTSKVSGLMRLKPFMQYCSACLNFLYKQKYTIGAVAAVTCVVSALLMASKFDFSRQPTGVIDPNRDFAKIPFDEYDATRICEKRTRMQFRSQSMVRTAVDRHSTRFDKRSGNYKIFMFLDVGDLRNYDEGTVHCFVDARSYVIDHYRTIFEKQQSLLDRALNMFGVAKG